MSAQQLEIAAELLGPIVDEVVFVDGATVHLWLTEPGANVVYRRRPAHLCCVGGNPLSHA